MTNKKNNLGLVGGIAALIVVLIVGGYFFSKSDDASVAENTAEVANSAVESSPTEQTPTPELNVGDFQVEAGNPVVAKVDGKDITRVDVYRFIQTMPANMQQLPATQVYPIALDQVINTRLVQTRASNAKIEGTPEFEKEMDIARQQIMRNLFLQQQVDKKIDEEKVKKDYEEFVKSIPEVEERRARHILVETEAKAKAVVERLKKEDADFAKLAAELSIGPTKSRGGDLGYFGKTEMVKPFADAAFGMEKNSILETPVKTQFGYHVIQLVDIRQRTKPSYEQFAPNAIAEMRREIMQDLLDKWRKKAKIEQFDINGKPLEKGANVIGIVPTEQETAK